MADPRFFQRAPAKPLSELAELSGAELRGNADLLIEDVTVLADPDGAAKISHFHNKKYLADFLASTVGAATVHPDFAERAPDGMSLLITPDPYGAFAKIAQAFYPSLGGDGKVHPSAVVHDTAELGENVTIGPNAVIGAGVVLGDGCQVGPNVSIENAIVGKRCKFLGGARVGQDGFGFAPQMPPNVHIRVPQLGRVIIEDDVDIGANACVDRGTLEDTHIGRGAKIDNMVQIAHGVKIGAGTFIAALAGVSGSTSIGSYCQVGGQTGFAGHITVGDYVSLAAQTGVMSDVEAGAKMAGAPARPIREFFKEIAALKRLVQNKKKGA